MPLDPIDSQGSSYLIREATTASQILREINVEDSRSSKTAIFCSFKGSEFESSLNPERFSRTFGQLRPNCSVRLPNPEPQKYVILTDKNAIFAKFLWIYQFLI